MNTLSFGPHRGTVSPCVDSAEFAISVQESVSADVAIPSLFAERGPFDPVPYKVEIPVGSKIADVERKMIQLVLDRTANDPARMRTAAQMLGISEKTLKKRIDLYGLSK